MTKSKFMGIILGIVTLFSSALGGIYFFNQSDFKGYIQSFEWSREWDKERYMKVGGNCWYLFCPPMRSYNHDARYEYHYSKSVYTGETCVTNTKGNRSCVSNYRSESVYDWKIYYTINDWRLGQTMRSSGKTNKVNDLYWPELNLNECDSTLQPGIGDNDPMLDCERPAQQRQFYYVYISGQQMLSRCLVDYSKWSDTKVETAVTGKYWTHQNLIDCNSLEW